MEWVFQAVRDPPWKWPRCCLGLPWWGSQKWRGGLPELWRDQMWDGPWTRGREGCQPGPSLLCPTLLALSLFFSNRTRFFVIKFLDYLSFWIIMSFFFFFFHSDDSFGLSYKHLMGRNFLLQKNNKKKTPRSFHYSAASSLVDERHDCDLKLILFIWKERQLFIHSTNIY